MTGGAPQATTKSSSVAKCVAWSNSFPQRWNGDVSVEIVDVTSLFSSYIRVMTPRVCRPKVGIVSLISDGSARNIIAGDYSYTCRVALGHCDKV